MTLFLDPRGRPRCRDCTSRAAEPKLAYTSRGVAETVARRAASRGVRLDVYVGPCGYWHLTTARGGASWGALIRRALRALLR